MTGRIVVVGAVAAGASAAAKARRTHEHAEIVLFDSGPFMSFANCGLPYYVGGEIASRDSLFVATPQRFHDFFNIDTRLNTEVLGISPGARQIEFQAPDGKRGSLDYDRLILATGTTPILPPIPGLTGPNMFLCRTVPDVDAIMSRLGALLPEKGDGATAASVQDEGLHALIIGGGYIGLECAEQLMHRGFRVTVVEAQDQLMGPLDPEIAQPVQFALQEAGATVVLSDGVSRIETCGNRSKAVLKSGRELTFDIGIIGTGVRPNVALAKACGLALGKTGALSVDDRQRTSDPAIFAAGDNCEATFLPTGSLVNIPLAGPANKQGRIAGQNAALDLLGADPADPRRLTMRGVLGTAIVRVGKVVAGGTGLSEKLAKRLGIDATVAYVVGPNHAGYYPGAKPMLLKILYDPMIGRLLGAQATGEDGVDKRLDVLATAIQAGMTVEDLEHLDLCYAPPFGSAKDVAVMAGFVTANALRGTSPGASPISVKAELAGANAPYLIDVRTRQEFDAGRLPEATNIPLNELRGRLTEIPKDRPIVLHCGTGYRSYVAQQILLNEGWTDVRNLYGGFGLARRVWNMAVS